MLCPYCETAISVNSIFCKKCGENLAEIIKINKTKSRRFGAGVIVGNLFGIALGLLIAVPTIFGQLTAQNVDFIYYRPVIDMSFVVTVSLPWFIALFITGSIAGAIAGDKHIQIGLLSMVGTSMFGVMDLLGASFAFRMLPISSMFLYLIPLLVVLAATGAVLGALFSKVIQWLWRRDIRI